MPSRCSMVLPQPRGSREWRLRRPSSPGLPALCLAQLPARLFQSIRIGSSPISNSTVMRRRGSTRSGGKSALELALLGAPRGARKSVFSPAPSTSSSWFQLDHHSRMSVFSDERKEILSENARIPENCCPNRISKSKQRGSEAKIGARMAAVATQHRAAMLRATELLPSCFCWCSRKAVCFRPSATVT